MKKKKARPLDTSLIASIPTGDDEGEYGDEFRASLLKSLLDIKQGCVYSMEEIKKALFHK